MDPSPLWSASLNPQSPRYQDWLSIFGDANVSLPIVSPQASQALLGPEQQKDLVYLLDWDNIEEPAASNLIEFLAKKFAVAESEVEAQLGRDRLFPIRTSDVLVSFSLRAFL
jgi:uncharacterized protein YggU (UPF0235/DUF167 family)